MYIDLGLLIEWPNWVNYKLQTEQRSTYIHLNWYQLPIIHNCTNKTTILFSECVSCFWQYLNPSVHCETTLPICHFWYLTKTWSAVKQDNEVFEANEGMASQNLVGLKMAVQTYYMELTTDIFISKVDQNLPRVDGLVMKPLKWLVMYTVHVPLQEYVLQQCFQKDLAFTRRLASICWCRLMVAARGKVLRCMCCAVPEYIHTCTSLAENIKIPSGGSVRITKKLKKREKFYWNFLRGWILWEKSYQDGR